MTRYLGRKIKNNSWANGLFGGRAILDVYIWVFLLDCKEYMILAFGYYTPVWLEISRPA